MSIKINVNEKRFDFTNFFAHAHFHPTEGLNEHWGKTILRDMAEGECAKYIRLYAMLEYIVSRDKNGSLTYDFTANDERLDVILKNGFKPLVVYGFMPACISKDFEVSKHTRYKGRSYYTCEPADYNEWMEVCRIYTEHIVEKYGVDEVKTWYLEFFNEPDGGFFLPDTPLAEKCDKYITLYDYFAHGIKSVSSELKVGGPATNGLDHTEVNLAEMMVKHAMQGKCRVPGKTDIPFDFFSVHAYSAGLKVLGQGITPTLDNILRKIKKAGQLLKDYGCNAELVLDEWDIDSCSYWPYDMPEKPEMIRPKMTELDMRFRDTEYYSAMYIKAIDRILNEVIAEGIPLTVMMLCMVYSDFLEVGHLDFCETRGLVTPSGFKKPIYHAHSLASKLCGTLVGYEGELPEHMGIIPTLREDGSVRIMLYYMRENLFEKIPNVKINISVDGLKGKYKLCHYRIDHSNCNSFTKWCELGMPDRMNLAEIAEIQNAGELSPLYPPEMVDAETYSESIIMTQNSVSYIELLPVE